mmetsp:Transcript_18013/g.30675  ORF Transcript_18013/g.30675 Transcript_18013/m.30675 type:complete len:209 (-) Transcript_18013:344-970(-)
MPSHYAKQNLILQKFKMLKRLNKIRKLDESHRKYLEDSVLSIGSVPDSSQASCREYEGGSRRERGKRDKPPSSNNLNQDLTKSQKKAGEQMKNIFHQSDILSKEHLKEVGNKLQKHGNKEKTTFVEKENEFVNMLREVQDFHLSTCIYLMGVAIGFLFIEFCFACFSVFYFGCLSGECQNGLICYLHYLKFFQTLFLMNTYYRNINEN